MTLLLHKAVRESLRYGVAVGKVRVLETRVLRGGTYERLLDAPSFAEQKRVLSDTVYGRYLEGARTADDVEVGLASALDRFYRFLDEANLPTTVARFFRVRYDFWNLRAALKTRALGVEAGGMLSRLGTVPIEAFEKDVRELPEPMGDVARGLVPEAGRDWPDLASIDSVVEHALFGELVQVARQSKSAFLRSLASLNVDVANAKSALLSKRRGHDAGQMAAMLMDGGSLSARTIEALYQLTAEELADGLAATKALAGISAEELADPARLDVATDNLVMRFLRRARHVPIGPEPVVAYVMAREAEVVSVRTLLIGKLAGIEADTLRARLRSLYV